MNSKPEFVEYGHSIQSGIISARSNPADARDSGRTLEVYRVVPSWASVNLGLKGLQITDEGRDK